MLSVAFVKQRRRRVDLRNQACGGFSGRSHEIRYKSLEAAAATARAYASFHCPLRALAGGVGWGLEEQELGAFLPWCLRAGGGYYEHGAAQGEIFSPA
jgi:hypothetical protein